MFLLVVKSLVKKHEKLKEVSNFICSKRSNHLKYLLKLLPQKIYLKGCSLNKCILKLALSKLLLRKKSFLKKHCQYCSQALKIQKLLGLQKLELSKLMLAKRLIYSKINFSHILKEISECPNRIIVFLNQPIFPV